MSNLDNLLGSHLSLISHQDARFEGILHSINAKESSIVLRDVKCLGSEDRVNDLTKQIPSSPATMAFVTFLGHEIKDLYVHEIVSAPETENAKTSNSNNTLNTSSAIQQKVVERESERSIKSDNISASQQINNNNNNKPVKNYSQQRKNNSYGNQNRANLENKNQQHKKFFNSYGNLNQANIENKNQQQDQHFNQKSRSNQTNRNTINPIPSQNKTPQHAAGTGEHLLNMKFKKRVDNSTETKTLDNKDFDFEAGLNNFNKDEVMANVADGGEKVPAPIKYVKDDFFDSLSCDTLDREEGRRIRLTNGEERMLNQDTFGAIALQPFYRRGYRGGGGGGGRGFGGRGRGRSSYNNNISSSR